jgi:hypothetical protein
MEGAHHSVRAGLVSALNLRNTWLTRMEWIVEHALNSLEVAMDLHQQMTQAPPNQTMKLTASRRTIRLCVI